MLQPPVIETAIHLLGVLRDAEAVAAASQSSDQEEFVAFDDTYVMYAYLVGFHISGALRFMSSGFWIPTQRCLGLECSLLLLLLCLQVHC